MERSLTETSAGGLFLLTDLFYVSSMSSTHVPTIAFRDQASGQRNLLLLQGAFINSGSFFSVEQFVPVLEDRLQSSPDPDLALINFVRFAEATFNRAALFNDLLKYPAFFDFLLRLFGTSRYLADILVREPELFRWLTASDAINRSLDRSGLEKELLHVPDLFTHPERQLDAIKRIHRREFLRIGARDIMGYSDLSAVTYQLSELADAVCQAVLETVSRQMLDRFPAKPKARFVVLGLGKLGGQELNYSSDIDLLLLYDTEGIIVDRRGAESTHHEYYNRLAERFVQALSQSSAEGYLYRVDTRLRPESGAGPLARSLYGYLTYYESRGELWERQMLIKARAVAGDRLLGEEFVRQVQPFIYPRTAFQHPADAIARIKSRIEAKIGTEANIKLMAGGIRDIEFIVQALQLLNGGKRTNLRERGTLRALNILREEGLLSDSESKVLESAYVFYRTIEHRLQIMQNTQTHTLPSDEVSLTLLARRLGFADGFELTRSLNNSLRTVRALFEQVMSLRDSEKESDIQSLIDGNLGDEECVAVLSHYRLKDMRGATKVIRAMTGTTLTGLRDMDARGRSAFRGIAPSLFREIAATNDPDLTLRNLSILVSAQIAPGQLFVALADPRFRRMILEVCAVSPRLIRGLGHTPLLLESVMADVGFLAETPVPAIVRGDDVIAFKQRQELRIGMRYVLGFSDFTAFTAELSSLADTLVTVIYRNNEKSARMRNAPMAFFALGKLGTGELNLDSDLDILMISGAATVERQGRLEEMAALVIQQLTATSPNGRLYDIDARLRPEGRNAPLVTQVNAYGEYLSRRATLWERQSLTRIRFLCGNPELGKKVLTLVKRYVYQTPLPADWVLQISSMRRKMESRSRTRSSSFIDIKLGAGGMTDVEFILQMIQLRFGRGRPVLHSRSVPELLAVPDLPVLSNEDRMFLVESYMTYRRIETLLRITLEEHSSLLPEDEKLETLAHAAGFTSGPELAAGIADRMKRVRILFDSFCLRLQDEQHNAQ